jgi:hypothetical protein
MFCDVKTKLVCYSQQLRQLNHLFTYGIFNNTATSLDYTATNGSITGELAREGEE